MKCLTIHQPWAWAIIHAAKRTENRTWPTEHRGPLLIHAGKSRAWLEGNDALPDGTPIPPLDQLVFGALLGKVEVIDCVRAGHPAVREDPFALGPWCWLLKNPVPLKTPIPYRGQQALFDVPEEFVRDPAHWLLSPLQ